MILTFFVGLALVRAVAIQYQTGRYYYGLGVYFFSLLVCSAIGVVVSVGMTLLGRRFDINYVVARSFYILAGTLMDIQIEVEGEEHLSNRPVVYVGNHQSMMDILYLGRIFPKGCAIMAKKELKWAPLLGQFMALSGTVFINRSRKDDAMKSLTDAGETMKERQISLFIFPEGTRKQYPSPNLLPFKKGAFHLAVQAGVPIVPMVCENYWHIYRKGVFMSGVLKVRVLPPIPTANLKTEDVNELATRTREIMLQALCSLSPDLPAPSDVTTPPVSEASSPGLESVSPPLEQVASQTASQAPGQQGLRRRGGSGERGEEMEDEDDEMVIVGRPSA